MTAITTDSDEVNVRGLSACDVECDDRLAKRITAAIDAGYKARMDLRSELFVDPRGMCPLASQSWRALWDVGWELAELEITSCRWFRVISKVLREINHGMGEE